MSESDNNIQACLVSGRPEKGFLCYVYEQNLQREGWVCETQTYLVGVRRKPAKRLLRMCLVCERPTKEPYPVSGISAKCFVNEKPAKGREPYPVTMAKINEYRAQVRFYCLS